MFILDVPQNENTGSRYYRILDSDRGNRAVGILQTNAAGCCGLNLLSHCTTYMVLDPEKYIKNLREMFDNGTIKRANATNAFLSNHYIPRIGQVFYYNGDHLQRNYPKLYEIEGVSVVHTYQSASEPGHKTQIIQIDLT